MACLSGAWWRSNLANSCRVIIWGVPHHPKLHLDTLGERSLNQVLGRNYLQLPKLYQTKNEYITVQHVGPTGGVGPEF